MVSVVVPVYKNEQNLPESIPRFLQVADSNSEMNFEFIFVVDGSPDNSLTILKNFRLNDPRIKIISLSRNFGAVNAAMAGIEYSRGDCLTVIAADMQDPPETLSRMLESWVGGKKVVLAYREHREDPLSDRLLSGMYYKIFRKFVFSDYPEKGYDLFLIDRQVVNELLSGAEKNMHLQNYIFSLGFEREIIFYTRKKREIGRSTWTTSKKIKLFIDSILSNSYMPIRAMSLMGVLVAFLSVCYGAYILLNALLWENETPGWASLVVIMTFIQGVIMVMLGVIGEYIWRAMDEIRPRKKYIIDEIVDE